MSTGNQTTLISRIGNWFRRGQNGWSVDPDIASTEGNGDGQTSGNGHGTSIEPVQATRSTFLRPWARRDQAITHLQEGFNTLTELMSAVRDGLERQGQRQDELIGYLAHLPQAIQSIPEANRVQGETLKAIHQQLTAQHDQQSHLVDILDKLREANGAQRSAVDDIRQSVDALNQHDQKISETLRGVGSAMQTVSQNSESSTQVLQTLRDNLSQRDAELERVLRRQNTRFTTMLIVAIVLSVAALTAVAMVGYLMVNRMH